MNPAGAVKERRKTVRECGNVELPATSIYPFSHASILDNLSGGCSPGRRWVDEVEAARAVENALEVSRRFLDNYLQRRPNPGFHEMPAAGCAVWEAQDGVGMDLRVAVFECYVAGQHEDLALLIDRDI